MAWWKRREITVGCERRQGCVRPSVSQCPWRDGVKTRGRKYFLEALLAPRSAKLIRYSKHVEGDGSVFYTKCCSLALEDVVLKRRDAPYILGHGLGWLKIKCAARDEFAIIGWTDPADSREGFGVAAAGLLRFPGEPSLCRPRRHRVTRAVLRDLRNRLDQLAVNTAPGAEIAAAAPTRSHWVIPELVAEDPSPNEHEIGGYPVFLGLHEVSRRLEHQTLRSK